MTLEELLNKLIEKGWKPFGESRIDEINRAEQYAGNWNWCCWGSKDAIQKRKSTRELVSLESGLWQFVTENKLTNISKTSGKNVWGQKVRCNHWVLKCALLQLSEIEQFLLDNIKIDET